MTHSLVQPLLPPLDGSPSSCDNVAYSTRCCTAELGREVPFPSLVFPVAKGYVKGRDDGDSKSES